MTPQDAKRAAPSRCRSTWVTILDSVIGKFRDDGKNIATQPKGAENGWRGNRGSGSWVLDPGPFRVHVVILAPDAQQSK